MPLYVPTPPIKGDTADTVGQAATQAIKRVSQGVKAGAGQTGGIRTVDADTFISSLDTLLRGDTTSAGFTLTLPLVSEYTRGIFEVVRSAGANTLTVAARGSDTINGGASITVTKLTKIYPVDNASWEAVEIGN